MHLFRFSFQYYPHLDALKSQKVTYKKSGSILEAADIFTQVLLGNRLGQAVYTTVL